MNIYLGFNSFKARSEFDEERLDLLLKGILLLIEQKLLMNNKAIMQDGRLWFEGDHRIITWRGIMTKLLCVPYESIEGWALDACRFRVGFNEKCKSKNRVITCNSHLTFILYNREYSILQKG